MEQLLNKGRPHFLSSQQRVVLHWRHYHELHGLWAWTTRRRSFILPRHTHLKNKFSSSTQ